tara:strand:- start:11605 stop:11829 length:225 start_codon:yes stop_codon:yes gene_type:complete
MKQLDESILFNFSVKLTQAGHVAVEHECLKPEEFKEVMDKWNDQYQNTEVIVALLNYLSNHSVQLERDIYKILR